MCSLPLLLLLPLVTSLPQNRTVVPAGQATTVLVTTDAADKIDKLIGDVRFADIRAVYTSGAQGTFITGKRLADAVGVSTIPYDTDAVNGRRGAERVADEAIRANEGRAIAVVLDSAMMLPFLRQATHNERASFPLSGAAGHIWVVTLASGYTSVVRGAY